MLGAIRNWVLCSEKSVNRYRNTKSKGIHSFFNTSEPITFFCSSILTYFHILIYSPLQLLLNDANGINLISKVHSSTISSHNWTDYNMSDLSYFYPWELCPRETITSQPQNRNQVSQKQPYFPLTQNSLTV